jgi:hypothetical protein
MCTWAAIAKHCGETGVHEGRRDDSTSSRALDTLIIDCMYSLYIDGNSALCEINHEPDHTNPYVSRTHTSAYAVNDQCTWMQIVLARRRARYLESVPSPRLSTLPTTQKTASSTRLRMRTVPPSCLRLLGTLPLQRPSDHHTASNRLQSNTRRQSSNRRHPSGVPRSRSCPDS